MRVLPPVSADLLTWATALSRYLARALSTLDWRNDASSAAEDGAILWDRDGYPVVTRGGAFVPVQTRVDPPTLSTDPGTAGDFAFDGSYAYFCIATDTWVRAAVATW